MDLVWRIGFVPPQQWMPLVSPLPAALSAIRALTDPILIHHSLVHPHLGVEPAADNGQSAEVNRGSHD